MNKQEAIESLQDVAQRVFYRTGSRSVYIDKIVEIINQIDEPQKVVVPKFVAEWIEYCKSNKLTLLGAFDPVSEHGNTFTGEVWKGIDWAKRNQDTFARAWFDGYEIEKEKLYIVEIPNPRSTLHFVLRKNAEGEVCIICYNSDEWRDFKCAHLTEAEIKKDFEWAWQFAKEVE